MEPLLSDESKNLLDGASVATIIADQGLRVQFANQAAGALLEWELSEIIKENLTKVLGLTPEQESYIRNLSPLGQEYSITFLYDFNDSESGDIKLKVQCKKHPVSEAIHYYAEVHSPTHQLDTEAILRQLGSLASTIGHDISNPAAILKLQYDTFNLVISKKDSISSADIKKRLEIFGKAIDKLNLSIDTLKEIARSLTNLSMDEIQLKLDEWNPQRETDN